jgi:hypothetical protein
MREFFLHNGMNNKNLSQFFHRCHEKGESKPSSRPFFPYFFFSVIVLILREVLRPDGDEFAKNRRRFLSNTCSNKINSFSFFPGVIVEEQQMSVRTPFFAKIRLVFHGRQFQNLGICGYFWPRRLKPTLKTCWGISPIYS